MGPTTDLQCVFFWSLWQSIRSYGPLHLCISLLFFLHPVCCLTISAFRNAVRRSLLPSKRYTAIFCYNSPPWIWQAQQLWQRLNPLRRIQSSGASSRSASTASSAHSARREVATAYVSTASSEHSARRAVATAYVSTASGATNAPSVRTYRALWKAAHSSAAVSAQLDRC